MTRLSAIVMLSVTMVVAAPSQNNASSPPPGTNSAGTAQPSGPPSSPPGVTTGAGTGAGMGTGKAATGPTDNTDAAIRAENDILDRKLGSICRGC